MSYRYVHTFFILCVYITIMTFISLRGDAETPLSAISAAGVVIAIITAIYLNKTSEIKAEKKSAKALEDDRQSIIQIINAELVDTAKHAYQKIGELRKIRIIPGKVYVGLEMKKSLPFFEAIMPKIGILPPEILRAVIRENTKLRSSLEAEFLFTKPYIEERRLAQIDRYYDIIVKSGIYMDACFNYAEGGLNNINVEVILKRCGIDEAKEIIVSTEQRWKNQIENI